MRRVVDRLHCSESDAVILRALGLIASGCFILLCVALHLTPKKIGA